MPTEPTDIKGLVAFYYESVKPLYSEVQISNKIPVEMLFEVNAAFDHLTRFWQYGETETEVVKKAYSHLKRACLDAFKLKVKEVRDEYDELLSVDIGIIDNGEFEKGAIALFGEIRDGAVAARKAEGDTRLDSSRVYAFDLWVPVYEKCIAFQTGYFRSSKVDWARKHTRKVRWRDRWERVVIGFLTGVVTTLIMRDLIPWIVALLRKEPPQTGP